MQSFQKLHLNCTFKFQRLWGKDNNIDLLLKNIRPVILKFYLTPGSRWLFSSVLNTLNVCKIFLKLYWLIYLSRFLIFFLKIFKKCTKRKIKKKKLHVLIIYVWLTGQKILTSHFGPYKCILLKGLTLLPQFAFFILN